jgi:hypothetical protein
MASQSKRKLGELLVQRGVIRRQQLEEALTQQRRKPGFIGKILVEMGALSEQELTKFLQLQRLVSKDSKPA